LDLIVGHFATLSIHWRTPWEMLHQQKAAHGQQIQELYAVIDQKDQELRSLRAELTKTQQLAKQQQAAKPNP
jgi:predicted metallo-beta-lactamase superfamily hydrolase